MSNHKKLTVSQILKMLEMNSNRFYRFYRDTPSHPKDAALAQSICDNLISNIKLGVIDDVGRLACYGSDELARLHCIEIGGDPGGN